jgi:hypothetical protein
LDETSSKPKTSKPKTNKMFQPEVEQDLLKFIQDHDYSGVKPEAVCEDDIPKWGEIIFDGDNKAHEGALKPPVFGKTKSLNMTLWPEGLQGKKLVRGLPKSGIIKGPVKIHRFGTIRTYGATHQKANVLGVRNFRDFANTMFYSTKYRHVASPSTPGWRSGSWGWHRTGHANSERLWHRNPSLTGARPALAVPPVSAMWWGWT